MWTLFTGTKPLRASRYATKLEYRNPQSDDSFLQSGKACQALHFLRSINAQATKKSYEFDGDEECSAIGLHCPVGCLFARHYFALTLGYKKPTFRPVGDHFMDRSRDRMTVSRRLGR